MSNGEVLSPPPAPAGALSRPHYEVGHYLAAADLLSEQGYRVQRLRRHNRRLHGWGVVCGLLVVPANDPARPWAVQVCPGYAIGPYGDEIELPAPVAVDIRDYLWRRPLPNLQAAPVAYIGVRYAEEQRRPVPAIPPACDCDDTLYKPSRIRDGFQIDALWVLPGTVGTKGATLCEQPLAACPECPDEPYVPLACVTLPMSEGEFVTAGHINNRVCRRQHDTPSE